MSAATGFEAALAAATPVAAERPRSNDPVDLRGLDGRDRTSRFVQRQQSRPVVGDSSWLFGEDGFGFDDLLDLINPLQHIPIISSIYRWITGDEISPAASMAGGALFGGPIGLAGAIASEVFDEATKGESGRNEAVAARDVEEAPAASEADRRTSASTPAFVAPVVESSPAPAPPASAQMAAADPSVRFIPLDRDPMSAAPSRYVPIATPATVTLDTHNVTHGPVDRSDGATFESVIAEEMMMALDKYQALLRSRAADRPSDPPGAGSLYDGRI